MVVATPARASATMANAAYIAARSLRVSLLFGEAATLASEPGVQMSVLGLHAQGKSVDGLAPG